MAFGCPGIECLLGKIASVGLRGRQAKGESVKRFIVLRHYLFKIIRRHKAIPVCDTDDAIIFRRIDRDAMGPRSNPDDSCAIQTDHESRPGTKAASAAALALFYLTIWNVSESAAFPRSG